MQKITRIIAAAVLAMTAGGGYALGASSASLYACLSASGNLTKVGKVAPTCPKGTTQINWNQVGAQGIPGQIGPAGPKGDKGDSGQADAFYQYSIKSANGTRYSVYALPQIASRAIKINGVYWRLFDSGEIAAIEDNTFLGTVIRVFASTDCSGFQTLLQPMSDPLVSYRNLSESISTNIYYNLQNVDFNAPVTGVLRKADLTLGQIRSYRNYGGLCVGVNDLPAAWANFKATMFASATPAVLPTGTATPITWNNFVIKCLLASSNTRLSCLPRSVADAGDYKLVIWMLGLETGDGDGLLAATNDLVRNVYYNNVDLNNTVPFTQIQLEKPKPLGTWTYDLG